MSKTLYSVFLACGGVVGTDSRAIPKGGIFFALRGERFDGNRFAADALAAGAAYAVVDDPRVATADGRFILVENSLLSLQHLAAHHRREIGIHVLAITGTNGKTTTKELVARVISNARATVGNLNNHIGVPLTLLGMRRGDFGVVEMGASAVGEIGVLCDIAAPVYGIITNIGRAHLEGFGGPGGVRKAKGELYDYLARHGGLAFVSGDDETLLAMAREREGLRVCAYPAVDYPSALVGSYNAANISAAAAVGCYFGIGEADIRAAVAGYVPSNSRSQRVETAGNTLILDCYNANPSSMCAALLDFAALPSVHPKMAILGDMAELGVFSPDEHAAIVALLATLPIASAILVGPHFAAALGQNSVANTISMPDTLTLAAYLLENPVRSRTVLLKASHSINLEQIKNLL